MLFGRKIVEKMVDAIQKLIYGVSLISWVRFTSLRDMRLTERL